MASPSNSVLRLGLALLLGAVGASAGLAQSAPDEAEAVRVWQAHSRVPADPAAVLVAGTRFEQQYPGSEWLPFVQGLTAWQAMTSGSTQAAVQAWERMAAAGPANPLAEAGRNQALRWLTRLDREQVRAALRTVYRRDVQYPATLEALRALSPPPPLTNRWGRAWTYRLESLQQVKGLSGQRYLLESPGMSGQSDLAAALEKPYRLPVALEPQRVESGAGKRPTLQCAGNLMIAEGSEYKGLTLVHVGVYSLIFTDADRWFLLPRPRP